MIGRNWSLFLGIICLLLVVSIAVPHRPRYPRGGGVNETAAIATLLNISSAQAQFQAEGFVDLDGDGTGEYGYFGEMSKAAKLRGHRNHIPIPVLSGAFRVLSKEGYVSRSGYFFRIYLASNTGYAVPELPTAEWPATEPITGAGSALCGPECSTCQDWETPRETKTEIPVDPDAGELYWCCYAWPVNYANSGTRTFFVNQDGDVFATEDPAYDGVNGPKPGAAFAEGGLEKIVGKTAGNATGQDGNFWRQVN
jgi:hypothetical protein